MNWRSQVTTGVEFNCSAATRVAHQPYSLHLIKSNNNAAKSTAKLSKRN